MRGEVARIIERTHTLSRAFDVGDPYLRRSLHLEASALACYWVESFSEDTPDMLMWAKLFSKRLMQESEAAEAYQELGCPTGDAQFFANRLKYYKSYRATWKLEEPLLACWIGIVNFSSLFRKMKAPPMIGTNSDIDVLCHQEGNEAMDLQSALGIDTNSQEYLELMGDWLKGFTEELATMTVDSSVAFVRAMIEVKRENTSAIRVMRGFKAICLVLAAWCVILPFLDLDQIWVYQLTRIAVTIGAVSLAMLLRGWQVVAASIVGILFNPIIPIDFDRGAWMVVDIGTAVFLGIVAFWPSVHPVNEASQK